MEVNELKVQVIEINKNIGKLQKNKQKLLKKLREICEHKDNIILWHEPWGEHVVVVKYQCLDCGLIELDQQRKQIHIENARRGQKNFQLL